MMSKLKEIIKVDEEVSNGFAVEDLNLNTMTVVSRGHFEWLIEQAERVQELEEDSKDATFAIDMLESENKRYREAKKQIEEKYEYFQDAPSSVSTGLSMAIEILDKALEGED